MKGTEMKRNLISFGVRKENKEGTLVFLWPRGRWDCEAEFTILDAVFSVCVPRQSNQSNPIPNTIPNPISVAGQTQNERLGLCGRTF